MADLPDWTTGVDILAQTISQLDVNVVAQSLPVININLTSSSITLNVNIASSGVTLNVNITGSTTLAVGIVGSVTLDVNITGSVTLSVNIASQGAFNLAIDIKAQSVGNLAVNIAASAVTLNVAIASSVTLNVNITGSTTLNVAIASSAVTFNINLSSQTKQLLTNGSFEDGNPPTGWILQGPGANFGRDISPVKVGTYSGKLTRAGADCLIYQNVFNASYKGRALTLGCWVYATVPNTARLAIHDGITQTVGSYHSGAAGWEWITVSKPMAASATEADAQLIVMTNDTGVWFDGALLVVGDSCPVLETDLALNINIAAQTANININVSAQTVGVYLQPEYAAKTGVDKNFLGIATNQAYGGGGNVNYTVTAGKTLYISSLGFRIGANNAADADKNQIGYALLNIGGSTVCSFGGNGGGGQTLSKPYVATSGQAVILNVTNLANHTCDIVVYANGYEV